LYPSDLLKPAILKLSDQPVEPEAAEVGTMTGMASTVRRRFIGVNAKLVDDWVLRVEPSSLCFAAPRS
jgi:hypothetical protein